MDITGSMICVELIKGHGRSVQERVIDLKNGRSRTAELRVTIIELSS